MALNITYLLYYVQDKEGRKLFKRQLSSCVYHITGREPMKGHSKDPMGGASLN